MKTADREIALAMVIAKTKKEILDQIIESADLTIETIINDTVFHEKQRLKSEKPSKAILKEKHYWNKLGSTFYKSATAEQEVLIEKIIKKYKYKFRILFSLIKLKPT